MEPDIVEEIAKAEAGAEDMLKHSRERAKALEKEAEEALNQFKLTLEEGFKARAEELKQLREKERNEGEARLKEELAEAQAKLMELGERRVEEAVKSILRRILLAQGK